MITADLAKFSLLAALSPSEIEIIAESFELELAEPGVALFREGDPADGGLFIAKGRVRVYSASLAGEAQIGPGDTLGTLSIVCGGSRMANAETLSHARVYRLTASAFGNLQTVEPILACRVLEGMVRESAVALREEVHRGVTTVDPTQRSD